MCLGKMIREKQKEIDELCKTDLVCKSLVDNYSEKSVLYIKDKSSSKDLSESLNALATYSNRLQENARFEFIKSLNITNEDLSEMFKRQVISNKVMIDILKFKGLIGE